MPARLPTPPPLDRPHLDWIGDCSLRVSWDDAPAQASDRLRRFVHTLDQSNIAGLLDRTPAFATVLLRFSPAQTTHAESQVREVLDRLAVPSAEVPARTIQIPVCYEKPFALDLDFVAGATGLTETEVIRRHSEPVFTVAFIGFTPGFPYLTGLPKSLSVPRHEKPRTRVPAGSVAITGEQAGIYPREVPGGWRVIGRTPVALFDPSRAEPTMLFMGDQVRFVPISANEFERQQQAREHNR